MRSSYIIGLLLLVFSFSETALAQTTQEQLIGTWTFDYEASVLKMNEDAKTYYESLDTSRKARIENNYRGRTITFSVDGGYILSKPNGSELTGVWVLTGQEITVTFSSGLTKVLEIESISATSITITPEAIGSGNLTFTQWHLTKN